MIKEVDEQYWSKNVSSSKKTLFFEVDFLEGVAESFSYNLHYFVFEDKNKVLMAAALYSDGDNIVTCLPYTYSSIYFDDGLSDRKYLLITNDFIRFLKLKWQKISLRLPVEIKDVRPFIWGGFKVLIRYTYLKDTSTGYHKSFKNNMEKAERNGMLFSVATPTQCDIEKCSSCLNRQLVSKNILLANAKVLTFLATQGQLFSFKSHVDNQCVCTSVMLMDFDNQKCYALNITDSLKDFGHAFINVARTNWCRENGIKEIDLCGANEAGIADFKSFINGDLTQYFIVHYSPGYEFFNSKIQTLKKIVKKTINGAFSFNVI